MIIKLQAVVEAGEGCWVSYCRIAATDRKEASDYLNDFVSRIRGERYAGFRCPPEIEFVRDFQNNIEYWHGFVRFWFTDKVGALLPTPEMSPVCYGFSEHLPK